MHVVRAENAIEGSEPRALAPMDYGELTRRIEDGDTSFVLLSVLPRASFESGRIPGSLNLPLDEIAERAGEVLPAKEQETVVYCASSACSLAEQGVILLRSLGYTRVREYPGGMEEWRERGGRIEHAVVIAPKAVVPPAGRLDRMRKTVRRLSPVAAVAWAGNQPLRVLFGIWFGTGVLFALLYWGMAGGGAGLVSDGAAVGKGLPGLWTAFWFSIATAMTSDYGDVSALGWMRLAVFGETVMGLMLFGSLVSKVLGNQQEEILNEVYRLTFENRLGRLRTNLHLVLSELSEISGDCSNPTVPRRRLRTRIEGVAMIFAGEMQAVRDLVRGGVGARADSAALETLFACVTTGLEELTHLLTCLPSGEPRPASLRRSLRRIAQVGGELCGVCSPELTPGVRSWMDQIHRLCHALCDEPRIGDLAPRFELPGSDGRVHRLAEYLGLQPVVLTWFPKAFTGG